MLVMSTTTSPTTTFDADALKRAIENRDAEALLELYADAPVVEVADHEHPPAAPSRAAGKDALRAVFADVYGRDMTHRVGPLAVDGEKARACPPGAARSPATARASATSSAAPTPTARACSAAPWPSSGTAASPARRAFRPGTAEPRRPAPCRGRTLRRWPRRTGAGRRGRA